MLNRFSPKQKLSFAAAVFMVLVVVILGVTISRIGKTRVSIKVIPSDAQVFIDGKQSVAGDVYLKPGTYTFSAKKKGFLEDKLVVIVDSTEESIGLIPEPNSDEARRWQKDNPALQLQREEIGGKRAALEGEYVAKNTPLIEYLPYTDVSGPFTIDFGSSKSRQYGTFLEINNSSAKGREKALQWIRSKGYDPTDFEIRYDNAFVNPILPIDTEEGEEGPNE